MSSIKTVVDWLTDGARSATLAEDVLAELCQRMVGCGPSRYSGHHPGWIEADWTPMKEIFEYGKISDKTRSRVRKSRDQRIRPDVSDENIKEDVSPPPKRATFGTR